MKCESCFESVSSEMDPQLSYPRKVMDRETLTKSIVDAINSLSTSRRLIFTLYHYDGLSVEEIARLSGIDRSVVLLALEEANKEILGFLKKLR